MAEIKSLQLYVRSSSVQESIEQTLKDRSNDFTTSLLTVINGNPMLQMCDAQEVVRTALKAASMRLPIDPALGLAYIIPYNNSVKETKDGKVQWVKKYEPQLQIGYKGFIELALRSQQYLRINVTDVREGEYLGIDRMTGDMTFDWIQDDDKRDKLEVTGYLGFFRLTNGFEKQHYMTIDKLEYHAKKYSKTYAKGYGKWADDFNAMSLKTVIKLLISKWGPKSTEIQKALRADQAAMADDDTYNYVDNDKPDTPKPASPSNPKKDIIEGEAANPPSNDTIDQSPKQPTEAEAPQVPPKSVKDRAAEWAKNGKAKNANKNRSGKN